METLQCKALYLFDYSSSSYTADSRWVYGSEQIQWYWFNTKNLYIWHGTWQPSKWEKTIRWKTKTQWKLFRLNGPLNFVGMDILEPFPKRMVQMSLFLSEKTVWRTLKNNTNKSNDSHHGDSNIFRAFHLALCYSLNGLYKQIITISIKILYSGLDHTLVHQVHW